MIDGTVQREWIAKEARDPATAVILLDVVLERSLTVIASVVGTAGDPQGRARQTRSLESSGVLVMPSNARRVSA